MKKILFSIVFVLVSVASIAQNIWENVPYKEKADKLIEHFEKFGFQTVYNDTTINNGGVLYDKEIKIVVVLKNNDNRRIYIEERFFFKEDEFKRVRIKGYNNKGDNIDETWYILANEGYIYYDNYISIELDKKNLPKMNKKPIMLTKDFLKTGDTYHCQLVDRFYLIAPTFTAIKNFKVNILKYFK